MSARQISCVLLLLSLLAISPASAQSWCAALLQGGIFDRSVTTNETFAADYFRSRHSGSSTSTSGSEITLGLPLGDVPVNFGISSSNAKQKNICDDRTSSFEVWQDYRNWSSRASPIIAEAFVKCIQTEGTQIWTERSQVANAFSLNVRVYVGVQNYPPTQIQFSFTPSEAVGKCGPRTKNALERGVIVENHSTFRVVCGLTSRTNGAEIGLIASSSIPYGNLGIRPYRPGPVFAMSTSTSARDGVKVPNPGDATYIWGADTLLDRYDGLTIVAPSSARRSATWNLDNLIPGLYQVLVTYAAHQSRPLRLFVDNQLALSSIAAEPTGSWEASARQQRSAGQVRITKTNVDLKLETMNENQHWPHFKELRLIFVGD